jgi:hypothetical protein
MGLSARVGPAGCLSIAPEAEAKAAESLLRGSRAPCRDLIQVSSRPRRYEPARRTHHLTSTTQRVRPHRRGVAALLSVSSRCARTAHS